MKIQTNTVKSYVYATLVSCFLAGAASATVLTFDAPLSIGDIDQTYGDNVTSTTVGGYNYGADEGFTPNVTVSYNNPRARVWFRSYGSLTRVLYEEVDGTGVLVVTMTADPGFNVRLHGFKIASIDSSGETVGLINVSNESGSLFNATDFEVSGTTFTQLDFAPTVVGSELTLTIDATNLGGENDEIGIDDIVISQMLETNIPEPSSVVLTSIGFMGLLARRRRCRAM